MVDDRESGFILIEVIVALTILVLGLSLLMTTIKSSMNFAEQAAEQRAATAEAQSMLAQLGHAQPLTDGETDGDFPSGHHWHLAISPFGDNDQTKRLTGHSVTLDVTWHESYQEKSLSFRTLMVASEP